MLTDLQMPGINGLELVETLRTEQPELRIALMSGLIKAEGRAQLAEWNVPFLQKPVTEEALKELLSSAQ